MIRFDELNVSTITIIIKSNISFQLGEILTLFQMIRKKLLPITNPYIITPASTLATFECLTLTENYTKKKKLTFPQGTISYFRFSNKQYGILKRKPKITCKKDSIFRNQVSLDIFVTETRRVNMMIFKNGNIKLAGCQSINNAIVALLILWDIIKQTTNWSTKFKQLPEFRFYTEMINISFTFPIEISKRALNKICNTMNDTIAHYEPTSQNYVTIKMTDDNDINDTKLVVSLTLPADNTTREPIELKITKGSFTTPPSTCFMAFPRRIIMSGVDKVIMKKQFDRLISVLAENIEFIKLYK
jgi:hypothetical protein